MLKNKVEMYVPMNTLKQEKELERVFKLFCKFFGGATVNPVVGGWIDAKGILIKDKIGIIYAYTNITSALKDAVKELAIVTRNNLNEDCILLVIDGKAEFY